MYQRIDEPGRTQLTAAEGSRPWASARVSLYALGGLLALLFAIYWPTFFSIVLTWERSDSYTHGFLIFPISAYLIWQVRHNVAAQAWAVDPSALLVLACLVFGWALAKISGVLVAEQLTWVAMIPTVIWLALGATATRKMAFPLAFLIFAVPFGEDLIEPMIEFTAAFTVHAVRLSNIPVYWEGNLLVLPSGNWEVVEACSGVRYLIASLALGTLYAYLSYRSTWRRLLFIALAVVVPVVANGLRAYMIVMIGHLSDMRHAVGVDHLIYGWVFFGLVMLLLFWIGRFWREDWHPDRPQHPSEVQLPPNGSGDTRRLTLSVALAVAVLGVGPVWAAQVLNRPVPAAGSMVLSVPPGQGDWSRTQVAAGEWKPTYINPTAELHSRYAHADRKVGLFVAFYASESENAEVVNSGNVLVQRDGPWRILGSSAWTTRLGTEDLEVRESRLRSASGDVLVWQFFDVGGSLTANRYEAKLRGALASLFGQNSSAAVIVFTPVREGKQATADGRATLQSFLRDMLVSIRASVESARQVAGGPVGG